MRLVGVEANDFLSYRRLDLDLSDVHQLAIVGKNGHGKSAILDAVLWCLFAKGRGASDELVREGASSMYVRTTWERRVRGQPSTVVITRSRDRSSDESSLSVQVDGEERTKPRIPATQTYIERLVGMGPKAMLAGPVMVQGDSAALLEAQPAARKDLLVELFQLERWEGYHEEAKRRRKMVATEQEHAARELDEIDIRDFDEVAIETELRGYRQSLAEAQAEAERTLEEVASLREQAAVLRDRAQRAEDLARQAAAALEDLSRSQRALGELERLMVDARRRAAFQLPVVPDPPDESARDLLAQQLADCDTLIADRKGVRTTITALVRQRDALAAQAASTIPCEGNPPTCRYLALAADARSQAADLDHQIDELANLQTPSLEELQNQRGHLMVDLRSAEQALKRDRDQMLHASARRAAVEADVEAARAYLDDAGPMGDELASQIQTTQQRHAALVAEGLRLRQDEYVMADLAAKIDAATALAVDAGERAAELSKAISTTERYRDEMRKQMERRNLLLRESQALDQRAATLDILLKAFHRDGIPTLILETALPEIETRANEVLARLPDDYALRLDTRAATKAGTFKDELRVTVLSGGRERPYHLLSGGQRFRVDFAMRIALAAVIAARVEATVDTLWLDEPLGPLDREGQEAVADTIAAVSEDFGLIAVVSHVPDFNDRFETRLSVVMEDGESLAVLQ